MMSLTGLELVCVMLFVGLVMHVCSMKFQAGAGATLGRTLWGMLGLGAFGFQLQEVPQGKRIITTTRSHSNKLVTDTVQAMDPHEVIRVGGAGNKVCDMACCVILSFILSHWKVLNEQHE